MQRTLRFLGQVLRALSLVGALAAGPTVAGTELVPAVITDVMDGDTVAARTADSALLRVRLANIDAPETSHGRCKPGQPWSAQARHRLMNLVKDRRVTLACTETDHYGRAVCDLDIGHGETASRVLVREGLAWANRASKRYVRDPEIYRLEDQSRAARRGLWAEREPMPPWIWRRTQWLLIGSCTQTRMENEP